MFTLIRRARALETVSRFEKLVLLVLLTYSDADGNNMFPSVATLAVQCGNATPRAVQLALRRLREQELIEVQEPAKRYRPTTYRAGERLRTEVVSGVNGSSGLAEHTDASGVNSHSLRGELQTPSGVNSSSPDQTVDQTVDQPKRKSSPLRGRFPQDQSKNVGLMVKLLWDINPKEDSPDVREELKCRCARLGIPYDSESAGKAMDSFFGRRVNQRAKGQRLRNGFEAQSAARA